MAKPPPEPDRAELVARVNVLRQELSVLKGRLSQACLRTGAQPDPIPGLREATRELLTTDQNLRALERERTSHLKAVKRAEREAVEAARELKSVNAQGWENPEALESEIRRQEFALETGGSSSVKRERIVIQRVKELGLLRPEVAKIPLLQLKVKEAEEQAATLMGRLADLQLKLDETRQQKTEQQENLTKLREADGRKEAREAREKERQDLSKEIIEKRDAIVLLKETFEMELKEYQNWRAEEIKREAEKKEQLRQKIAAERKAKEEEYHRKKQERIEARKMEERRRKMNPHEDEIQLCADTIKFLTEHAREVNRVAEVAKFNPETAVSGGFRVLKKSGDDDDAWLFGDRTKKKKQPKAPKKQSGGGGEKGTKTDQIRLPIPPQHVGALKSLGVSIPRWTEDVPGVIKELKDKSSFFESKRRTLAEIEEEEAREEEALVVNNSEMIVGETTPEGVLVDGAVADGCEGEGEIYQPSLNQGNGLTQIKEEEEAREEETL